VAISRSAKDTTSPCGGAEDDFGFDLELELELELELDDRRRGGRRRRGCGRR